MGKKVKVHITPEDVHANYINTLLNGNTVSKAALTPKEQVLKRIRAIKLDPKNFREADGTIVDKSTNKSITRICIITEDSGNGFQFILSYILQNYSYMNGIAVGAIGKDSIRYILEEYNDYDAYIFAIDRGISESDFEKLNNTIREFRKNNINIPMYIFQPQCMEEIWLSFYKLDEYIKLNNVTNAIEIQNKLKKILGGKLNDIDYTEYKTLQTSTPEQICEKYIFELTDGTPFKCYHGQREIKGKQQKIPAYLSPCWRCPCCTVNQYDKIGYVKIEYCKKPNIICNKLDYIAKHSLLCGMTYIMDKIYGLSNHDKGYWNNIDISYINKLVKEI